MFNHDSHIRVSSCPTQAVSFSRFSDSGAWLTTGFLTGTLSENWDAVLTEFIPRIGLARTREAYQLGMMALIARVNDTHASLCSSLNVRAPIKYR